MRRWMWGLAAGALVAGAALAQPAGPVRRTEPPPGGYTQLFISPCGEPWRAGPGDPYPMVAWFNAVDTNHDGAIDLAEFRADHEAFFNALDRDHNNLLDSAEISFYEHRVAPDIILGQTIGALAPRRGPSGLWGGEVVRAQYSSLDRSGQQSPAGAQGPAPDLGATRRSKEPLVGAAAYGLLADPEPVSSADSNLDGRVTRTEFLDAADRRFRRLDRKGDGKLTMDELPHSRAQIAAEGSRRRR